MKDGGPADTRHDLAYVFHGSRLGPKDYHIARTQSVEGYESQPGLGDTSILGRAFLPSSRMNIAALRGRATLLQSQHVCFPPEMVQPNVTYHFTDDATDAILLSRNLKPPSAQRKSCFVELSRRHGNYSSGLEDMDDVVLWSDVAFEYKVAFGSISPCQYKPNAGGFFWFGNESSPPFSETSRVLGFAGLSVSWRFTLALPELLSNMNRTIAEIYAEAAVDFKQPMLHKGPAWRTINVHGVLELREYNTIDTFPLQIPPSMPAFNNTVYWRHD
ncbi:hypothetical protein FN846DRAFT_909019 [Sphaerosporella brunnea]|uniref:Uncharacterized protein n=1 Tax=Sphaerosporella brunnea TaxID=1250544 RepID=A0A5J5ES57_9PEZI|nr:hypothetical protein FN846DRAFT_909019 [Sphaerosporella brunnea]